MKIGVYIYGSAAVAYGITDLVWGGFDPADQPLQAWGDHVPGATIFAYIAGIWLVVAGAALLWRGSRHVAAASLTLLYGTFVLFPLPRLYTAPHFRGYHAWVYIYVLAMVCQEIILFVAAVLVWKSLSGRDSLSHRAALIARWTFGLCSVDFGLAHLTAVKTVIPIIPKWLPLSATFWAVFTGIAFVLAGLAIVSGVLDVLAAKLLGLMLLAFSALVLAPMIFAFPRAHAAWGVNAYNLTAVGAAWIVAQWLAAPSARDEV
jgi:cell shape-determining protein MreD